MIAPYMRLYDNIHSFANIRIDYGLKFKVISFRGVLIYGRVNNGLVGRNRGSIPLNSLLATRLENKNKIQY